MIGFINNNFLTVIDGLAFGVLLFTLALGLTLIFGVMNVLNLAHGAIYLLGSYIAFSIASSFGTAMGSFILALVLGLVVGAVAGAALALMTRPLVARGHLDQALLTLGVAFVVAELLFEYYGRDVQSVFAPSPLNESVSIFGTTYPAYRLIVIVVGLLLAVGGYIIIERTKVGSVVRASVVDAPMVRALGYNTGRLTLGVFAVGTALATFGGVLGAPILNASPGLDIRVLILALVVVVIGGLGSIPGALVGALIIGQVQSLGVSLAPSFASFLTFGAMALVLLLRPAGILGTGRAA